MMWAISAFPWNEHWWVTGGGRGEAMVVAYDVAAPFKISQVKVG
jgi:hypothetical protein